ncbi:MAG: hypothetical protein ACI3YM_08435 [Prevotella sp.]
MDLQTATYGNRKDEFKIECEFDGLNESEKTINPGWMFKLDAEKSFAWVNIPHTCNLDAYNVRNYYRGKAFYKFFVLSLIIMEGTPCLIIEKMQVLTYHNVEKVRIFIVYIIEKV